MIFYLFSIFQTKQKKMIHFYEKKNLLKCCVWCFVIIIKKKLYRIRSLLSTTNKKKL